MSSKKTTRPSAPLEDRVRTAELALIASSYMHHDGASLIPQVSPFDLRDPLHTQVWERLQELHSDGHVDALTVGIDGRIPDRVRVGCELVSAGLRSPAAELSRWRAAKALADAADLVSQFPETVADTTFEAAKVRAAVLGLQDGLGDATERLGVDEVPSNLADIGAEILEDAMDYEKPPELVLKYGLPSLDERVGGIHRTECHYVIGYSGHGKSCFGLQAALEASARGHRALIASTEMSRRQWTLRAWAWMARMPYRELLGRVRDDEQAQSYMERLRSMPIEIMDQLDTVAQVEAHIALRKAAGYPVELVVVDYLQQLQYDGDNEPVGLAANAYKLKRMAERHECMVIVAAQVKRGSKEPTGPPTMWDIRGASAIENSADSVTGIWRNEAKEFEGYYPMDLLVSKARESQPGEVSGDMRLGFGTFRIDEHMSSSTTLAD